jgi:FkbM family methyltransferase
LLEKYFIKLIDKYYNLHLEILDVSICKNKYDLSGEKWFLSKLNFLLKKNDENIFMDIGANVGKYSKDILELVENQSKIFAFEPHPTHFRSLCKNLSNNNIELINKGCGNENATLKIYDIKRNNNEFGYTMDKKYLEWLKKDDDIIVEKDVEVIILDEFIGKNKIKKIHLLKIDVEGYELNVLKGLENSLNNNIINIIQFEFNVHNIDNKVFMRDFFEILTNYNLFRLLPSALLPIDKSDPPFLVEIFGYQNIIAINKSYEVNFN